MRVHFIVTPGYSAPYFFNPVGSGVFVQPPIFSILPGTDTGSKCSGYRLSWRFNRNKVYGCRWIPNHSYCFSLQTLHAFFFLYKLIFIKLFQHLGGNVIFRIEFEGLLIGFDRL